MVNDYNIYKYGNSIPYKELFKQSLPDDINRDNSATVSKLLDKQLADSENLFRQTRCSIDTLAQIDNDITYEYLPYLYSIHYSPMSDTISKTKNFVYLRKWCPEIKNSIYDTIFVNLVSSTYKCTANDTIQASEYGRNRNIILNINLIELNNYTDLYNELVDGSAWTISKGASVGYADVSAQEWAYIVSTYVDTLSEYSIHGINFDDVDSYLSTGVIKEDVISFINLLSYILASKGLRLYIKTSDIDIAQQAVCNGVILTDQIYKMVSSSTDIPVSDTVLATNISNIISIQRDNKEVYTIEHASKNASLYSINSLNNRYMFCSYATDNTTYDDINYGIINLSGEYIAVDADGMELQYDNYYNFYYTPSIYDKVMFVDGVGYIFNDVYSEVGAYEYNANNIGDLVASTFVSGISGCCTELYVSGLSGVYFLEYMRDNIYTYNVNTNTLYLRKEYNSVIANSEYPGVKPVYNRIPTPLDRLSFLLDITRDEGDTNQVLYDRIINARYYPRNDSDLGIRNSIAIDHDFIEKYTYTGGRITISGVSPESIRVNGQYPQSYFIYPVSVNTEEHNTYLWSGVIDLPSGGIREIDIICRVSDDVRDIDTSVNMPLAYVSGYKSDYNSDGYDLYARPATVASSYNKLYQTEDVFVPGSLRVWYQGIEVTDKITEVGRKGFIFDPYTNANISGVTISGLTSVPGIDQFGDVIYSCISTNNNYDPLITSHYGSRYVNSGVIAMHMEPGTDSAHGGDSVRYKLSIQNLSDLDLSDVEIYILFPLFFNSPNFSPYDRDKTDVYIQIDGLDFLNSINKPNSLDVRCILHDNVSVNTMTDDYIRKNIMNVDGTTSPTMRNIVSQIQDKLNITFGKAVWDLSLWIPEQLLEGYVSYLPNVADPDISNYTQYPYYNYYISPTYFGSAMFGVSYFGGTIAKALAATPSVNSIYRRDDYDSGIGGGDNLKPYVDESYRRTYISNGTTTEDALPPRYLRVHNGFYSLGDIRKYLFARKSVMYFNGNEALIPMSKFCIYNSKVDVDSYARDDINTMIDNSEVFVYGLSGVPDGISGYYDPDYLFYISGVSSGYYLNSCYSRTNFSDGHIYEEILYGNGFNNIIYASFYDIQNVYIEDEYGRSINNFEVFGNRIHINSLSSIIPMVYSDGTWSQGETYYTTATEYVYAPSGDFSADDISAYNYKLYTQGEAFDETPVIDSSRWFKVRYYLKDSYYVEYNKQDGYAKVKMTGNPTNAIVVYDSQNYNATNEDEIDYHISDIKLHPSYIERQEGFVYIDNIPPKPSIINIYLTEDMPINPNRGYPILLYTKVRDKHDVACYGHLVTYTVTYTDNNGAQEDTYSIITTGNDNEILTINIPTNITSSMKIIAQVNITDETSNTVTSIYDSLTVNFMGV